MQVRCVCQRSFDVPINAAGKQFRCPHCGHSIKFPDTVLAQIRKNSLIATGPPTVSSAIVVPPRKEPTPKLLLWTAGVVAITSVIAIALLVTSVDSSNPIATPQPEKQASVAPTSGPAPTPATASSNTFGDPSRTADPVPTLGTQFFRQKAPIDMTDTEWVVTLQEWGELPDWWSNWPYSQAHPWSYPLQTQVRFFRDVRETERTDHVSTTKFEALRKEFLSKQRDYEPYPANSPNNTVDRYISTARTSLSRELMEQQLDEAAKLLQSMLRPNEPTHTQAVPPSTTNAIAR